MINTKRKIFPFEYANVKSSLRHIKDARCSLFYFAAKVSQSSCTGMNMTKKVSEFLVATEDYPRFLNLGG